MNKRIIRVLWADEDYMPWESDQYIIELVAGVTDADELGSTLARQARLIDAVIVDANFADKGMPKSERTGSGLTKSNELRAKYGEGSRPIPFFLFTGRNDDVLKEIFGSGSGLLDYFIDNDQKFSKLVENPYKRLFDRIDEVVSYQRTPEFHLRNLYRAEFEAAKMIDDATENLLRGLLYIYEEESWKTTQDYFNPARKIVERIIDSCISMNLLPPHISLNTASRILGGNTNDFSLTTPLMEKPLAESLRYFLSITQDGSHDMCDLQLGVDQYVRRTENVNLYLSILHIAMDLLLWHKEMKDIYNSNSKRLWTANFVFMGNVSVHSKWNNVYYTDKYQLENKSGLLKVGDLVGIRKSGPNNNVGLKPAITDFVYETNYIVL